MTAFASRGTQWFASPLEFESPATVRLTFPSPRTGEECDGLLDRASRMLHGPAGAMALQQLAGFLGAESSVWTYQRRVRLAELIASMGASAIEPVLEVVTRFPQVQVLDEAERVLSSATVDIAPLRAALNSDRVSPAAHVVLLNALSHRHDMGALGLLITRLNDDADEVRDAAAYALATLAGPAAIPALERRLAREQNPVVKDALANALEEASLVR